MIFRSALCVDMHRIGEPVTGMMAGGDFENPVLGIAIGPQDAQGGGTPRDIQSLGDLRARSDRLNILGHMRHFDPSKLFKLAKDRRLGRLDLGGNLCIITMNKGIGDRDRLGVTKPRT